MRISHRNLALLEDILDRNCRDMTQYDLEQLLQSEMGKPVPEANRRLIQVLLNILNPSDSPENQAGEVFAQFASSIESAIALNTFIESNGNPYGFETVYDDVAFLMAEQYQAHIEDFKEKDARLLRDSAAKGEAGQFMIVTTVFGDHLGEALLGAVQAAGEYLMVTDECLCQTTGEDLEVTRDVSRLHMEAIRLLIRYAEMGGCENLGQIKAVAVEAERHLAHIMENR